MLDKELIVFEMPIFICTCHTSPVKIMGLEMSLCIGVLKVKLSSPNSPVLTLPRGQCPVLPFCEDPCPRRQKMNLLSQSQLKKSQHLLLILSCCTALT